MAITVRSTSAGISAVANGSATSLTPVGQNVANDVALLLIAQEHDSDTVTVTGGWTKISTWVYGTSIRFWLYGRRNPTGAASPVVSRGNTSGRFWAYVREFVGCTRSGNAWETVGTPASAAAYSDPFSVPGVTSITANAMIVNLVAAATGNITSITSVTATSPATFSAAYNEVAVGGAEVSTVRSYVVKATAGATGNVVVNFGTSPDNTVGGITLALTEDARVPSHTFDAKVLLGGLTSNPTTGVLSVGTGCTVIALGVLTRNSTRTGGVPTLNGSNMVLASSAANSAATAFVEMFYLTGSFFSTMSVSIPNSAGSTVWGVASSYKAPTGRLSAFDAGSSNAESQAGVTATITTSSYSGAAVVSMMSHDSDNWVPSTRTGTLLYEADAGAYAYGAQYLLQEVGGATSLLWGSDRTYIMQETFESGVDRNLSGYNSWTGTSVSYLRVVSSRAQAGSRSIEINNGTQVNFKSFGTQTGVKFTVDFYFMSVTSGASWRELLTISNGIWTGTNHVVRLRCNLDDNTAPYPHFIGYENSSGTTIEMAQITENVWHHCEVQVNLDGSPDTFQIWLDDVSYGPFNCAHDLNTATGISVSGTNIGGTTVLGIDSLNVYAGARGGSVDYFVAATGAFKVASRVSQIVDDVVRAIESIVRRVTKRRHLNETERISDSAYKIRIIQKIIAETINITHDAFVRFQLLAEIIAETMNMTETSYRPRSLRRLLSETEGLSDTSVYARVIRKIRAEVLSIIDSIIRYFVPIPTGGQGIMLTDLGALEMLNAYFNNDVPASRDLTFKLYINDYTPTDVSTTADFVEAAGGGYAAKTLTNGQWSVSPTQDPPDALYDKQTWTLTGPLTGSATIYGYYVVDADNTLIFAERASNAFQPIASGDYYDVSLRFKVSRGMPE